MQCDVLDFRGCAARPPANGYEPSGFKASRITEVRNFKNRKQGLQPDDHTESLAHAANCEYEDEAQGQGVPCLQTQNGSSDESPGADASGSESVRAVNGCIQPRCHNPRQMGRPSLRFFRSKLV